MDENSENRPSVVDSPIYDKNPVPEISSPPIPNCESESYTKPNYVNPPIPSNQHTSKISLEHNIDDNIPNNIDFDKNNVNPREPTEYQACNDDKHSGNQIDNLNKPVENIRCNLPNLNIKHDLKTNEKPYHDTNRNHSHLENFEHEVSHKISCSEYDSGIDRRQIDHFTPTYSEVPDPRYYGTIIQGSPPQYYTTEHVYDGNAQEVFNFITEHLK